MIESRRENADGTTGAGGGGARRIHLHQFQSIIASIFNYFSPLTGEFNSIHCINGQGGRESDEMIVNDCSFDSTWAADDVTVAVALAALAAAVQSYPHVFTIHFISHQT